MSTPIPGIRTLLVLLTALLLLNGVLVVWTVSDGLLLLDEQAQAATRMTAERLAGRLRERGTRDLTRVLAELAPPAATHVVFIDAAGERVIFKTTPAPAQRAPDWFAGLMAGPQLEARDALPEKQGQVVVIFDTATLAAPYWLALRIPWWLLNAGVLLFVVMANVWMGQKLRRLRAASRVPPTSPLLKELLREEHPALPRPAVEPTFSTDEHTADEQAAQYSGAALLVVNQRGIVSFANPAAGHLFGYDRHELVGKPVERLVPPWRQEELHQEHASPEPFELETQRLSRRGHMVDVLWHSAPLPGPAGEEPLGRVWTFWDITRRKRDETVLRLLGRGAALSQDGLIITDAAQDNAIIYANDAVTAITGYAPDEILGRNPRFLYADERNQEGVRQLADAIGGGRPCRVLLENRRKDGRPFWNELSITPISDGSGRVTHFIGLLRDVTDRHQHVQELMHAEARLRTVIDDAPVAICIADGNHIIRSVNAFFARLFSTTAEFGVGRSLFELLPEETWQAIRPSAPGAAVGGGEISVTRKGGERLVLLASVAELDGGGERPYTVTFMVDITGRKRAEQALAEAKERAQVTLESIGDGVITTNAQGIVDYLNPVAERLTGWVKEDVQGMPVTQVFKVLDEETREPLKDPVERALRLGRVISVTRRALLISNDEREFGLHITATPIRDREQHIVGAVVVFRDVSETRAVERQISQQAKYDALTGLYNRREFQSRLEQALVTAREEQRHHVLGYLDLDRFKVINDTCGHGAGDEVLRQVATRLQRLLRAGDILARLGGDEFAILLYSCSLEAARRVAEHILEDIRAYRFVWQDRVFELGVSIGLVPITSESGGLDDVLREADAACYAAKNEGRNRVHVFDAETESGMEIGSATAWLARLREGMEQDRFVLFTHKARRLTDDPEAPEFQQVSLRLRNEQGDLLPPAAFMPIAERYRLLARVDEWKLATLLARIGRNPPPGVVYGVTLSGQTLTDSQFLTFVGQQFERSGAPRDVVCFVIDESDLMSNFTGVSQLMASLKELGCRIGLDNFGYGRTSFAHLNQLPVDFLRMEGKVVHSLQDNPVEYLIAETISRIGQLMHLRIIAMGVGDERTLEQLANLGVDYAEGEFIDPGRPLA
ncbi:MAG: PAS domain S-box protein [Thiohalomonadaceae bacterium]